MKYLFLLNSMPFPPRHGVELPLARLIERLAKNHSVDIAVWGNKPANESDYRDRLEALPAGVSSVGYFPAPRSGKLLGLLAEMIGIKPPFYQNGSFPKGHFSKLVCQDYDVCWVSPMGGLGIVHHLRRKGHRLARLVAVGLNDTTYGLYMNGFRYLLKGRAKGEGKRVANAFRTPWLFIYERRYLKTADVIHVQTAIERKRLERLFRFSKERPRIICIQNGRSHAEPVVPQTKKNAPVILFMTHLSQGRANESVWFREKVWPRILKKKPDARLWLVGSPPDHPQRFPRSLGDNIDIKGYVDNLQDVLAQTSVAVVPTLHNSGWVNRVSDYLGAGIPVVGCREPLSTITGLVPGEHAAVADTPADFADTVLMLLDDRSRASEMATKGCELAKTFPDWDRFAEKIETELASQLYSVRSNMLMKLISGEQSKPG